MNALGAKLHRALVQCKATNIGVSFPQKPSKGLGLGVMMRLHSDKSSLMELMAMNWLRGMRDHTRTLGPLPVPSDAKVVTVRRRQAKSSGERIRRRLARRLAAREGISYEVAMTKVSEPRENRLDLPFLQLRSQSTGQDYRLYIEQREVETGLVDGQFSFHGLSRTATLPLF